MSFDVAALFSTALGRGNVPVNPTDLPNIERDMVVVGPPDGIYPSAGIEPASPANLGS